MGASVVRAENLTKFYGARRGIEEVTLDVAAGEIFGFLGPNGAGKTTTIRLLLDLIRPTSGRVSVLGMDPRRDGARIRARVGYLPGDLRLRDADRAAEWLRFLGDARGGVSRHRVAALAERFELDLSQRVRRMSKGNRQKLGLVQAFMHEPDLLILDEPTASLDPLMQQNFLALLREIRAAGQSVFMSSHVLGEVQQVADRVGVVRDGTLVEVAEVAALRERAVRRVEVHFAEPVPPGRFASLPGVRDVRVEGTLVRCVLDGRPDALVKAAAEFTVVELVSFEPDLEEMFLAYYTEGPEAVEVRP